MSDEYVDIARRICEAAWRRPTPDIETLRALGHPDHEMFTIQSLVEGGGYSGVEGFRRWLASWDETFGSEWESTVEHTEACDDDRVLVAARLKVRGVRGRFPIEQPMWVVMTFRDGKAVRSEVHTDRDQALQAAGRG